MKRALALLGILAALPSSASVITFADVCEPARFVQTAKGLEIFCVGEQRPWMTMVSCARPARVGVKKSSYCAGLKYAITCTDGIPTASSTADQLIAVTDEPIILACATP